MDDEPEYGLVMPFVAVASNGGPFDDQAYTAGYEMGQLDGQLAAAQLPGGGWVLERTVRDENQGQADLVGMKHGFAATFEPSGVEGWTFARFRPMAEGSEG